MTADCFTLIEQELADSSGISGTAVKLAYKTTVNTFMPGHVAHMVGVLAPDMVARLEPLWADFTTWAAPVPVLPGQARRRGVAGPALHGDRRPGRDVRAHGHQGLRQRFSAGHAVKHVQGALARVGDLVMKYAG